MITLRWADLSNGRDAAIATELTNEYANDANAIGKDLPDEVLRRLPEFLSSHETVRVLFAYDGDAPVGLATCVLSLSTFAAKSILNIHDIVVKKSHRGQGIGEALISEVEAQARRMGCCKLSLEVADSNPARSLYERVGFAYSGTFMTKAIE